MAKKPDFTVYHTRSYVDTNGEEKSFFTAIGSAWSIKDGGMSVEVAEGLSVSGRFVILARKERDDSQPGEPEKGRGVAFSKPTKENRPPADELEDEIPF